MAGYVEQVEHWVDDDEIRELFSKPSAPKEIDEELGLELKPQETIFSKYGVKCDPQKNSFHRSLYEQFQARGRLSEKQVNALRR